MLALALENMAQQVALQEQAAAYQHSMQSMYCSRTMWRIQLEAEDADDSVYRLGSSSSDYSSTSGDCHTQVTMWSSGALSNSWLGCSCSSWLGSSSSSSNSAGSDESSSCSSSGTPCDADASRVAVEEVKLTARASVADLEMQKAWLAAF